MANETILVVDDNPANLKLLRVLLAASGYDVYAAQDAEEARAVLAKVRPHLVLMDLQMPGTDGLSLTRELRADASRADLLIVAVTSFAMKGDEERALAAGCNGYLAKPIDTRTLPRLIAQYLQSSPSLADPKSTSQV